MARCFLGDVSVCGLIGKANAHPAHDGVYAKLQKRRLANASSAEAVPAHPAPNVTFWPSSAGRSLRALVVGSAKEDAAAE
jgi:hypothetical protein